MHALNKNPHLYKLAQSQRKIVLRILSFVTFSFTCELHVYSLSFEFIKIIFLSPTLTYLSTKPMYWFQNASHTTVNFLIKRTADLISQNYINL